MLTMTNTVPCWCSEGDVCTQRVSIWENDRNEKWKSAGFALLILRLWLDVCLMLFHIINLKDPNSAKPQKAPPRKVKENAISEGFHWMKWIVFVWTWCELCLLNVISALVYYILMPEDDSLVCLWVKRWRTSEHFMLTIVFSVLLRRH